MRKIQMLGLALVAMFAFGAFAATSAFANTEWLVEGKKVAATVLAETEGSLELIKFSAANGTIKLNTVQCEGILDGTIGPPTPVGNTNGVDEVTKVLSLNMEEISSTPLTGLALGCLITQAEGALDCRLNSLAAIWPDNLPWLTELELMTVGGATLILDKLFKGATEQPGYDIECELGIGGTLSELCEGATSGNASNTSGLAVNGVLLLASEEAGIESERADCTGTGEKSAINLGDGDLWATPNGDLMEVETAVNDCTGVCTP